MSILLITFGYLLFGLVVAAMLLGLCYLGYDLIKWWRSQ